MKTILIFLSLALFLTACIPRSVIVNKPDGIEITVQGLAPTPENIILSVDVVEGEMTTQDTRCKIVDRSWSCMIGSLSLLESTKVKFLSESARYTCIIAYIDKGVYNFVECPVASGG